MLEAEGTGKTIEKAIEDALVSLKAPREDVDIKILNEGGLFKKAKVLVTISEDAREKYIKKEKFKEKINSVKGNSEKDKERAEKNQGTTIEERKENLSERREKILKENEEFKPEATKEPKETKKEKTVKEEKVVEPEVFLEGFFKTLGKAVEISTLEDERFITYSVEGDDLGDVIGRRGEAFYALSSLLVAVAGKRDKKVLLDVGGYRAKRADSLTGTAKRMADKVAKTGRYMKLEPMNPSERRVIHTALQDDERVTTLSKGTEPHRYVIIFPKEYSDKN